MAAKVEQEDYAPPSFDGHRETTYATVHSTAPFYSVLIRLDPNRQDASAPVKGAGLTLGLGYFWNALQWRIDASYEHYHFDSAPDDPADEIGYGDQGYLFIQRAF